MMRNVLPRPADRVVLPKEAKGAAETVIERAQYVRRRRVHVGGEEFEQLVDAGALDSQPPVHKGFAEIEAWVEEQLALGRLIVQVDAEDRSGLA